MKVATQMRLVVVAVCVVVLGLGVVVGSLYGRAKNVRLQSEIEIQRDEKAYVITAAERDARMLNAKTEMLEFVRDNLTAMLEVIDTYRTAVYDMSVRIRELEAE